MKGKGTQWTEAHIKKLLAKGKIAGYVIQNKKLSDTVPEAKQEPSQVIWIREALKYMDQILHYKVEEEYKFHPKRRWRFDFALPELKIAIEYEGLQSERSRHTTLKGYTGDSEKYNEAQRLGWKVLRYTVLNYKNVSNDVKNMLRNHILGEKKI